VGAKNCAPTGFTRIHRRGGGCEGARSARGRSGDRPYRDCAYLSTRRRVRGGAERMRALWRSPLQGLRVSIDAAADAELCAQLTPCGGWFRRSKLKLQRLCRPCLRLLYLRRYAAYVAANAANFVNWTNGTNWANGTNGTNGTNGRGLTHGGALGIAPTRIARNLRRRRRATGADARGRGAHEGLMGMFGEGVIL
jgi:hypothetical protein